jgi:hypothetical protein
MAPSSIRWVPGTRWARHGLALTAVVVGVALTPVAFAQEAQQPAAAPSQAQPPGPPVPTPPVVYLPNQPQLEPRAVEILQAMSAKLASAQTLSFTSIATYESPARTGQPLAYLVKSEITLQRPDKLRVITPGDGPASEFFYDGKTVMAYTPGADLVAVADAPATIDEMLRAAYRFAAIYFPFTDVIVADPWADLAANLRLAFVVGQSVVVGDTKTDIVAIADDTAQAQIWVGAEDRLPRMIRATFFNEPGNFRHTAVFSHWKIDPKLAPDTFTSEKAAKAKRIPFAPPG